MTGVILYGPPAAGKDTIGATLAELDSRFEHYQRIKVGPGRSGGYRLLAATDLSILREAGRIIWENQAYGATYAIDHDSLLRALSRAVPVLHVGQPSAVDAVRDAMAARWLVVELWCPRGVALDRFKGRSDNVAARLHAWDATPRLNSADLQIDTSTTTAIGSALQIVELVDRCELPLLT